MKFPCICSLDTDSEEMEDEIPSDDDTDFFPIDESVSHPNQSNNPTTINTRTSSEQSTHKHSNSLVTSTNHPQDSNFEYTGKNTKESFFESQRICSLVLSQEQIVKYMDECIKEVNEVIKLSPTIVRLLLHHFRWDKEKLMERFYDLHDLDELFKQAHIVNPFKKPSLQTQSSHSSRRSSSSTTTTTPSPSTTTANPLKSSAKQICMICCSPKTTIEMTGIECGHPFCLVCWEQYLTYKIMHEGIGQTIACPALQCDILVDDEKVLNVIKIDGVRRKYQHLITNSFVECNRSMRWCPGLNCTNAIKASYCDVAMVTCTGCQTSFCFQCGQAWHEPIKCKWLKKWQKKCHDDSETSNWIAANTKECPKCHATIGRNHPRCFYEIHLFRLIA